MNKTPTLQMKTSQKRGIQQVEDNQIKSLKGNKRANYTVEEDEAICKAWVNVSECAAVGTDQTGAQFFDSVFKKAQLL